MRFLLVLLGAASALWPGFCVAAGSKRVVLIVWDGMRPDFISEQNTPTLFRLAARGVTFRNHHSVYLSSTEVNGTALATGAYPARDGIIANLEYRPQIDPLEPVHTEFLGVVRKGDELTRGHYVGVPTIAELVRDAGGRTVIAGAKPVVLLADRAPRASSGAGISLFAGATLPASVLSLITNRLGPFPVEAALNPTRNDWTTSALLEELWADGVPEFSLLWMNQPDLSQHFNGPGSEPVLAGLRNEDKNLARLLAALDAKGASASTDILIVSDHGCSTVSARVDLAEALTKAGLAATREFKRTPQRGDIVVVSNGGSSLVYVIGHDKGTIRQVVHFLQNWECSGVIFSKAALPGTFPLHQARIDSVDAPDIVVSMRWTSDKSTNGTPGEVFSDIGYGPGQGTHVSLSSFDMHATLVAAGPDFRSGFVDSVATGNVDVAPTVLWILGVKPKQRMDGRVLSEALSVQSPEVHSSTTRTIEAKAATDRQGWWQYLKFTEVNSVRYLDEGNGRQVPRD